MIGPRIMDYKKIKQRRYHHLVYFPKNISELLLTFLKSFCNIDFTNHALEEMDNDKFGEIPKPSLMNILHPDNILVEYYEPIVNDVPSGYIQKILIRVVCLSKELDYSYLISREGYIVSAWANSKEDKHRLTNKNGYYDPNKELFKEENVGKTITINR